jgi:hypothetical protein
MTKPRVLRILDALETGAKDDFQKTMLRTLRHKHEQKVISDADLVWLDHAYKEYKTEHQVLVRSKKTK